VARQTVLDAEGRGLRIEFVRLRDRYAHRILAVSEAGRRATMVLESIEGRPRDRWPPSPALQGLNIDDLKRAAESDTILPAMLIGMSGCCHWSLSAEPHRDPIRVDFDVACRVSRRKGEPLPNELTTNYLSLNGIRVPSLDEQICLIADDLQVAVVTLPHSAGDRSARLVCRDDGICIQYPLAISDGPPLTARWRYSIRLLGRGGA
jgi:hypothetical protein